MQTKNRILVILVLHSCLLVNNTLHAAAAPPGSFALSCGVPDDGAQTDSFHRKWDSDSKFLHSGANKSVSAKAEVQDSSLPDAIPYMTSRIFTSESSYKFPVNSTSRHILRLHFYPSTYPNFNISNSYFSVVTGKLTLVNNFSAYLTAQALTQSYIIKEYSLAPIETGDTLTVTFKPSDKYPGTFAFINGMELIPEPSILFDDKAEYVRGGSLADGIETFDATIANMQMLYRLNVGGQYIIPTNDSEGLMRAWYDDNPYVYGAGSVTAAANTTIEYNELPPVTAPLDVYRTMRNQGPDPNVNKVTNLTWILQADANFTYLVRLHFCDMRDDKVNQRVFAIYLNNLTAVPNADVFGWVKTKAAPMRKDFVVYLKDQPGDDYLWVALHPDLDSKPQYFDAFLNGMEVFKISDARSNLAGPNPTISEMMQKQLIANRKTEGGEDKKSGNNSALIGGAAGGAAAFGVAAAIFFVAQKRKRRVMGNDCGGGGTSSWLPLYGNSHTSQSKSTISGKSQGSANISSDAACNCRYFSLAEIKQATKSFDESNVIGVGGFGKVYKGIIDGNVAVAIKRSNPSSEQGVNEFVTEIEMLSKLRHRHLVSLIGFCEEGNEMVLVYDYMGQGTLREHLYKGNKTILSWKQRLEILIGSARGLHYLHTGAKYTIIHRDVKTTNILLDDKWVAKVSDFGLSKTGPNMNQGHVSTVVKGSFGYLDPEYFRRQQLTEKSDVYSFGVVLFEVLCARPALNPSLPKEQVSLADHALQCQRKGTLEDIIDPHLKGKIHPEGLKKFADTAEKCLSDHGTDRPSMGDVLWNLEFVLNLETNPDGAKPRHSSEEGGGSIDYDNVEPIDHNSFLAMHRSTLSLGSEHDGGLDQEDNPSEIFSQIVNPKGR